MGWTTPVSQLRRILIPNFTIVKHHRAGGYSQKCRKAVLRHSPVFHGAVGVSPTVGMLVGLGVAVDVRAGMRVGVSVGKGV